jgi:cytochrome c biogenesis protein CcmG/thiol:disulfide interchange protein DsbE
MSASDRSETPGPPSTTDGQELHPTILTPARKRRGQRKWGAVGVVIGGVGLLTALLAFGLGRDPTVIRSPLVGRRAPAFTLRTLDGSRTVRLSNLRGQVVIVNFWASWCAACREEHPALQAAWERYRDQGVVLLGVDFEDRKGLAIDFMREMGGDWPVVEDPGGRTALDYGVYGVPETFFIGRDGVVRFKRVGPSSYELLTDQIQHLLSDRR